MILILNGPGRLANGKELILYPSRWDSAVSKASFRFYPYELAYLSQVLKREQSQHEVKLLDGNIFNWDPSTYFQRILYVLPLNEPHIIVSECSSLTLGSMTWILQELQAFKGMQIEKAILCGPAVHVDQVGSPWTHRIVGEYEDKVLSVINDEPVLDGLVDLNWLPWPEDKDIFRIAYQEINHYSPGIVQLYPTRGCPLSCTFCVVPSYYGGHGHSYKSHRCRDVDDVCDEIEYLSHRYPGFRGCYFNEEAHNANVEWLVSFCHHLIDRGLNRFHYDAMCGYWTFNEGLIALMAEAGYKQIRFGVESTSELVGKTIKKTMHIGRILDLLGCLKKYGIHAYGTFQIGAPGSSVATDMATLEDLKSWRQRGLMEKWQVSTSTPQPHTPFYAMAKEQGWLVTEDLTQYNGFQAVVSYPNYSAEQINMTRQLALREGL